MAEQKGRPSIRPQLGLERLEQTALVRRKKGAMFIGVPKDVSNLEKRVPLTPNAVKVLVSRGHRVRVERGAGEPSYFSDREYSEAGAEIADAKPAVYEAGIVVKMEPPTQHDINLMHMDQVLISPLQLPTLSAENLRALMKKRITGLAFEYLRDDSNTYPYVRCMSEIAGNTAILIASEYMSHMFHGKGVLLGGVAGVPPAKVVILGAGVVGEYATRTALGLGAEVRIFDDSTYKIMRLQNNIGARVWNSVIEPGRLASELQTADVAVGAIHAEIGQSPVIVTEQMVMDMPNGSVVVDVSIDQGGCFETSEVTNHENPTFTKYGVIHYCVPNIPSRVSRTASYALSNILYPALLKIGELGGIERHLELSPGGRNGTYLYKGKVTNRHIADRFDVKHTEIDLLFALRM